MYYLRGFLRTWNSVKNEGCNYSSAFPGWGREFIVPLSDYNSIILQDDIAAIAFNPSNYFLADMNLDKYCGIAFKVLDRDSLELVEKSTRDWVRGILPQSLNEYNERDVYLKMPFIKEGGCSFD